MGISKIKSVFLDRDGVINYPIIKDGKPYPPKDWSEFRLIPGVPEGINLLKEAGFLIIVVTNQPDVGRGTLARETVEEIHTQMRQILPLDEVRVCYDDGKTASEFRKPNPGMILASAKENNIDLKESYMVGDRWKDIDAGKRAGLRTVFIDYGYDEELRAQPDYRASSFLEAARLIVTI